jgi:hypothetical protein
VDVALAKGTIPVIVNVNGAIEASIASEFATAVRQQDWLRLNVTLTDPDGEVPDHIVAELIRGFNHTRQETKRQRVFAAAAVVLAVTAGDPSPDPGGDATRQGPTCSRSSRRHQ